MWIEAGQYYWKTRNEHRPQHLEPWENAKNNMADYMKKTYTKALAKMLEEKQINATVWADLLSVALNNVEWGELAGDIMIEKEIKQ